MIIIFEPQCTGFAHEQFNAGFLYGYLLAYPEENIVFFGEKEHIKCIKAVFSSADLSSNKIEFTEMEIPETNSLAAVFEYSRILKNLLTYANKNDCNKIVFLSIHTYSLMPLKYLLQFKYNNSFKVHIAMHGILEFVKRKNYSLLLEIYQKVAERLRKIIGIAYTQLKYEPKNRYLYEKLFKISLHLFSNKNIAYFVFREDSLRSVKKYLPDMQQYFKSIDLPYIYKEMSKMGNVIPANKRVFATIGQGDIFTVQKVVRKLNSDVNINVNNYEVRIIGSGKWKQDGLAPIKYIGNGQGLSRAEIEEQIKDVQYVLFFYDPDSYELMTSGSFFDAIAYCKPMIFIKNRCFDYYYQNYKFGYRCENIDEMIVTMQKLLIGNDKNYLDFNSEIRRMQNDTSIISNYCKLKFNEEST
ncbi:MAG: hypothetical protein ACYC2P_10480 [Paludibacteraceae bacterium]